MCGGFLLVGDSNVVMDFLTVIFGLACMLGGVAFITFAICDNGKPPKAMGNSNVGATIPKPRSSCYKHAKRMAYCADCNPTRKVHPVRG